MHTRKFANGIRPTSTDRSTSVTPYRQASVPFVRALPEVLSDLELIAVFREVIAGRLEWAHRASEDGPKTPERARAALRTIGRSYSLTAQEIDQLRTSVLWKFIK